MYLNNNDKGETTFPDYDVSVKPETGKVLVLLFYGLINIQEKKTNNQTKVYYRKLSTLCLILKKHF